MTNTAKQPKDDNTTKHQVGDTQKNENNKELENELVEETNELDDENFLKDELEQLEKAEQEEKNVHADFAPLLKKVKELEDELKEKDEIARNSQINYLHLKSDFDMLQRQTQQKIDNAERDSSIKIVKEFLPFIENLRKSLLNLTEDQKSSPMGEGLQMMYDNFLKSLEKFNIKPIEALGLEPNAQFHEPVSMQPVEDDNLKGKIIQEFQQGFVYEKNDETIVISPSRVIVGN